MITRAYSVCFEGIEARLVEIECVVANGLPNFTIVGLPDKAISEARERIRAALGELSIALPSKRITINLIPADLPKEGAHLDLPIALAMLAALDIVPPEDVENASAIGELSLDGRINPVSGALPSALKAAELGKHMFCPAPCGAEAAWIDATRVIAAPSLLALIQHMTGQTIIAPATPRSSHVLPSSRDMSDVKGQERAKRALEIAAAGRHHVLMVGTPGSGKSMLAARLPSILPPMTSQEALETSMIHSLAGTLGADGLQHTRPFRDPHHTASMAAIVGGGRGAKPGEISLAHNGVLFLDEFPEFPRNVLETLRQPLETGQVVVARANAHIQYPCKFSLIAAANPCKCGYLSDPDQACSRAPQCGADYMARISGPLLDRFDLRIDVPAVHYRDLTNTQHLESSAQIADRVLAARTRQSERYDQLPQVITNADLQGADLEHHVNLCPTAAGYFDTAAERLKLTARGYHRILRVARTIADLDDAPDIEKHHLAEAISFRMPQSVA